MCLFVQKPNRYVEAMHIDHFFRKSPLDPIVLRGVQCRTEPRTEPRTESAPGAIYSSLGALLRSFRELREAEAQAQAGGDVGVFLVVL